MVRQKLPKKIGCIGATNKHIEEVIAYFHKYRVEPDASIEIAKAIADNPNILSQKFLQKFKSNVRSILMKAMIKMKKYSCQL